MPDWLTKQTSQLRIICTWALTLLAFCPVYPNACANAAEWTVDQQDSSIRFSVQHLTFSSVSGRFTKFSGSVDYDGVDLAKAGVSASIASDSINTKSKMRDDHLKNDDVLNVREYPSIKFVSKRITPHTDGSFEVLGDLELHGIVRPVTLLASPITAVHLDSGGKKHISTKASVVIDRKKFGVYVDKAIDKGGAIVSDQVKVELTISLVEKVS